MHLRRGTEDASIYDQVVNQNEYGLPDSFKVTDVIVDLGANCGAFMWAAAMRGAGEIHCFEPEEGNFDALKANAELAASHFNSTVHVHRAAVMHESGMTRFCLNDKLMTASGLVNRIGDQLVHAVTLTDILASVNADIRLIKMDIEGAEVPVLHSTPALPRVRELIGELHYRIPYIDWPEPSDEWLRATMERLNFDVEIIPNRFMVSAGILSSFVAKPKRTG